MTTRPETNRNGEGRKRGPQPGAASPRQAVATANAAWHAAIPVGIPDWVLVLAEACDQTSQTIVAKRLNYSGSVVSAILNNSYKGNLSTVEKAVRGALMAEELTCPVLGEMRKDVCLGHQKRAQTFASTSTLRVRMYQACRGGCVHSRLSQKVGVADAQS